MGVELELTRRRETRRICPRRPGFGVRDSLHNFLIPSAPTGSYDHAAIFGAESEASKRQPVTGRD
jgi:hypothetical protein